MGGRITWRPFELPKDVSLVNTIYNAGWPGLPWSDDEMLRDEAKWPARARRGQFLGETEKGSVVAEWMDCHWQPAPGRYFLHIMNHPDHEHLAEESLEFLMNQIAPLDPKEVKTFAVDVRPERGALLERHGFSVLESQPFTRFDIPETIAEPECELRLATFAELEAEGFDWKLPLAEVSQEMVADIPSLHAVEPSPIEEMIDKMDDRLFYNPDTMYAVMDGRQIAAMTRLVRNELNPALANTAFTGTARAYRRRGLSRAVKLFSFHRARAMGIETVVTDNLENNPMYQINLELGFQPWFRMDMYLKKLNVQ